MNGWHGKKCYGGALIRHVPMKGVVVVGVFRPLGLRHGSEVETVHAIQNAWHLLFGDGGSCGVRVPRHNATSIHDLSAEAWHHDCNGPVDTETKCIFFWCNKMPIQFSRNRGHTIWSPEPWQVVLWDNTDPLLQHRRPRPITTENQRWSIVDRRQTSFRTVHKELNFK